MNIIDVNESNVSKTGFFCKMSQKKSAGYLKKLEWLGDRFNEGMKIKMLDLKEGGRGFIEYIPGEYAWRPVYADDYMFIHCLWVVGSSKGKGYSKLLLDECVKDAEAAGKKGVAMLSSESNWLAKKEVFIKYGFEVVASQPPFDLLVKKFKKANNPILPTDWEERAIRFVKGLTVIRTDQCPYHDDAAKMVKETAEKKGIKFTEVKFKTRQELLEHSPSPYGVFGILLDGRLLSYYYLLPKELEKMI
ncbi:MAG: GNAT family N-acetyltransferase [bacterium]